MHSNPFTDAELERRVASTRRKMATRGLDMILLSSPENIFYLIGLDHWGYFAPTVLIVEAEGELILITRAMEKVVIRNQVRNAAFIGHADTESAADKVVAYLAGKTAGKALGVEGWSSGLAYGMGAQIKDQVTAGSWHDITGMLDEMRLVKSAEEQVFMRQAARSADAGTQAAIAAIHDGAREADVAAECLAAMTRAGSTPPGFGPFLRPAARMAEEHTSWGEKRSRRSVLHCRLCLAIQRAYGTTGQYRWHINEDAKMAEICIKALTQL